jgi:hypothetical protein
MKRHMIATALGVVFVFIVGAAALFLSMNRTAPEANQCPRETLPVKK